VGVSEEERGGAVSGKNRGEQINKKKR